MTVWTQDQAIDLAVLVELIAPEHNAHVALTGGCLYKNGPRKDCDLLIYRVRQAEAINTERLFRVFDSVGLKVDRNRDFGWCVKAEYEGKPVDLLFPERDGQVTETFDPHVSSK